MFVLFFAGPAVLHMHILQLGGEGDYEHFAAFSKRVVLLLHEHLDVCAKHQQHCVMQYCLCCCYFSVLLLLMCCCRL